LEGIAFQISDILSAMRTDLQQQDTGAGNDLLKLKVDGGASNNNLLMQFQADLLRCEVSRPSITSTTALGAALQAGLTMDIFKSTDQIRETWREERRFSPTMEEADAAGYQARWEAAVRQARTI
ncbi:MAG: FGGY-family carbohydrate kinase, partial [Planctomycetota bacterium]